MEWFIFLLLLQYYREIAMANISIFIANIPSFIRLQICLYLQINFLIFHGQSNDNTFVFD